MPDKPEVWLRGALDNVPALLQPVAHALLQAREEVNALMVDFPVDLMWQKPAGLASPGFHLQHLAGVIDRLFTYARAEKLNPQQLGALAAEGVPNEKIINVEELVSVFNKQVDRAIEQLSGTDETILAESRGVGRQMVPSTVIGLYVHAAEHTMRHTGQLLVTAKVLINK